MRHFPQLDADAIKSLFHIPPAEFTRNDSTDLLSGALGASLYLPAVRPDLARDIARCHAGGIMSMICCLEDAIRDDEVADAEEHLIAELRQLAQAPDDPSEEGPLLFVRVRTAEQITRIVSGLGDRVRLLSGFVLPKFEATGSGSGPGAGAQQLAAIRRARQVTGHRLLAMPILESQGVAAVETRVSTLLSTRRLLEANRDLVLAVRVGVTDLSGVFGLRRPPTLTVWDLGVVAQVLSDIINVFTRHDGTGFVVVGPVWEYFDRQTMDGDGVRGLENLIREVQLDRANGLLGKTIIHPSHAMAVHAQSAVSHEEYSDATAICVETDNTGGVLRSEYNNKMNEVRPHRAWAGRTLHRAAVFGVTAPQIGPEDLLRAAASCRALV